MTARRRGGRLFLAALAALLAIGSLTAAPAAVAADLPPVTNDADEVRQTADDIVARDEFQLPEKSLFETARDWIGERIASLVGGGTGSIVGWLVLALAVGAAIWFGTRFGRTVQADRRVGVHIEGIHRRTPAEWRAEAEALEADGAWKEALRCRYRALVGDLVAQGVLDDVAGRTTGEFRREVSDRAPGIATDFHAATELFELAWYADAPTGPEESTRFREAADRIAQARSHA